MDEKDKLGEIAKEIRGFITERQKVLELSFVEDTHTYYIRDENGEITTDFPSVSTVIKQFYEDFPELKKSLEMSNGDVFDQDKLLKEWRATSDYANNKGSRVHYFLEMDLLKMYGSYKEVRKPIFDCDEQQIKDGNAMIDAGHDFIRLMHRRGAVLLDTEMVLGSAELKYTGQPDKVWLMYKDGKLGFVITDWKTNKQKNMEVQPYTVNMLKPFEKYDDTSLTHYMIQLPLYGRLLLNMLKGTKYSDLEFFGCVIVHLKDTREFVEYRVSREFQDIVMTMPPLPRIDDVFQEKKEYAENELKRIERFNEAKYIKENEID
jgi:hypothetical protein